jgi:hypothetical protein
MAESIFIRRELYNLMLGPVHIWIGMYPGRQEEFRRIKHYFPPKSFEVILKPVGFYCCIKRDRSNENLKKKWSTPKNNGLNIRQAYDAEVYVCIRRKGESYEFKSTEKALPLETLWPLLLTEYGRRCLCW